MSRRTLVTVALVLGVVALFAVPLLLDGGASDYAGSDGRATEIVEDTGYTPWYDSLFSPSGEVESGLFALQAGIGGAVLGYVVGRLRGRRPATEPATRPATRPATEPAENP